MLSSADSKKTKLGDEHVVPSAKKRKRSAGDGIETEPKNKSKKNDLQTKNNKSKPSIVIESDEDVGENTIEGSTELKKKKKNNRVNKPLTCFESSASLIFLNSIKYF